MTVSSAHTLLWGLSTELPDPTDPHLPREGTSPLSYLCVDTLEVFQSFLDGPWLLTVILPGSDLHRISGAPEDGETLAGIAEAGALLVTDEPAVYQNTGTKDDPVWTAVGSGGSYTLPDATTSILGGVTLATAPDSPTAPIAVGDNDARLSDARPSILSLVTKIADYTALTTDQTILVGASGKRITLPDASTVPAGYAFDIKNTTAGGTTTVDTAAGNIDGASTYTGLAAAKAAARFVSDGTDYWIL